MPIINPDTKALILDFGGVIYQISHMQQFETFSRLGINNFFELYSHTLQSPLFADFECGKFNPDTFRKTLNKLMGKKMNPQEIDRAWNSILVGFPRENVLFLEKLSKRYKLYLLSNTNSIHYDVYINEFTNKFGYNFNTLFEKVFWSFKVGMRKPNADIYQYVKSEIGINHNEMLFIDDTKTNTEAAIKNGIPSLWLAPDKKLSDLFDKNLRL